MNEFAALCEMPGLFSMNKSGPVDPLFWPERGAFAHPFAASSAIIKNKQEKVKSPWEILKNYFTFEKGL
jgi:hypothetical protein